MKLIYLHLYKDTYLIFMQANKQQQPFKNEHKIFDKRKKNVISKIKSIFLVKLKS